MMIRVSWTAKKKYRVEKISADGKPVGPGVEHVKFETADPVKRAAKTIGIDDPAALWQAVSQFKEDRKANPNLASQDYPITTPDDAATDEPVTQPRQGTSGPAPNRPALPAPRPSTSKPKGR